MKVASVVRTKKQIIDVAFDATKLGVGDIAQVRFICDEGDEATGEIPTYEIIVGRITMEDAGGAESGPRPYLSIRQEYAGMQMGVPGLLEATKIQSNLIEFGQMMMEG